MPPDAAASIDPPGQPRPRARAKGLTPLEHELLDSIERRDEAIVTQLQGIRTDVRIGGAVVAVIFLFLVALIASGKGIDPKAAAEAVQILPLPGASLDLDDTLDAEAALRAGGDPPSDGIAGVLDTQPSP